MASLLTCDSLGASIHSIFPNQLPPSQTNPDISLHMLYAKWENLLLLIFLLSNLLLYFLKTCFSKKTLSLGRYVLLYHICVCVCVCVCVCTHIIIILHCTSLETKADAVSNLRLSVVAGL